MVRWKEEEISDVREEKRSHYDISSKNSGVPTVEKRVGTADWRAFVREVHLVQEAEKQNRLKSLRSSYFPDIKR
jgi:hypothetical protein